MHTVSRIRQVLNERSTQAAVFSFFLLILGAELCSYSTSIFELENSRFEQIHTIGSQQIIAHRMVKDITLLANDPDDASVYSQLDADLTRFSQQHQNLLNSTPSDQASTEILNHQISPLVLQLTQKISRVLSGSQPASTVLNSILIEEKHLLPALARYQSVAFLSRPGTTGHKPQFDLALYGNTDCAYLVVCTENRTKSVPGTIRDQASSPSDRSRIQH